MSENSQKTPIQGLMGITMEKLREMVDVQTIIGDPVTVSDSITIIPVSKVSYGFVSGGTDLPSKTPDLFGGGAGAGVSIKPVAFLVVKEDEVRVLQIDETGDALASAIRSAPDVINSISSFVKKSVKKKGKDTSAAETTDTAPETSDTAAETSNTATA